MGFATLTRQCFDICAWIFDFQHCQGSVGVRRQSGFPTFIMAQSYYVKTPATRYRCGHNGDGSIVYSPLILRPWGEVSGLCAAPSSAPLPGPAPNKTTKSKHLVFGIGNVPKKPSRQHTGLACNVSGNKLILLCESRPKSTDANPSVVRALHRKEKKIFFAQRKPQWILNEFYFLTYKETPRGLFSPKIVSARKHVP